MTEQRTQSRPARGLSPATRAWRSTFTRRWHTNFDLCDTVDYVGGHQGRCLILLLSLVPDASRDLILAVATHDQGEMGAGADMNGEAKRRNPVIARLMEKAEVSERIEQGMPFTVPTWNDLKIASLVDRLDAWLWMMRHKPQIAERRDWVEDRARLRAVAEEVGLLVPVSAIISETRGDSK